MEAVRSIVARLEERIAAFPAASSTGENQTSLCACPECGDTGWRVKENGGRRAAFACACQVARRIVAALPPLYRGARLDDFPSAVVARVAQWMRTRNGGLLLYGPVGTGKTHLAAAIVRAAVEAGSGAVFCRAADVYRALRDTFDGQQKEGSIIDRLTGAELLVLDDVAAGSLSDFERRTTLEIIDRRISAQLPSVVTTNWTVDEIARKMDERIASRLAGFTSVAFTGCDRRAGGCEA